MPGSNDAATRPHRRTRGAPGRPKTGTGRRFSLSEFPLSAGLAPHARDSGAFKGRRTIWGGRAELRNTLHMGLIAAIRRDNPLRNTAASGNDRVACEWRTGCVLSDSVVTNASS
jgi:transposase